MGTTEKSLLKSKAKAASADPVYPKMFLFRVIVRFFVCLHTRLILNYTHVGPGGFFSGGTEKSCPVKINPPKVAHQCNASISNKIRPTRSPWRTVKLLWGAWLDRSKLFLSQIFWDSVGRICPNFNDSTVLQLSKVGVEMEMIEKGSHLLATDDSPSAICQETSCTKFKPGQT